MTPNEIAHLRLQAQYIARPQATTPNAVLTHLGALQAQDYAGALWSLGLRLPSLTRADVEQAIADRTIVRTWPMRGTLHFVPAADARWMLQLLTPRVLAAAAGRHRQLELDAAVFTRSRHLLTQALEGSHILSRPELYAVLERGGVSTVGQRGIHILGYLSQQQVLCFGPHQGKQPTFVLLDEWISPQQAPAREEALQTLAERYFTSHGPATLHDFAGWSGLTMTDARLGVGLAASTLQKRTIATKDYWMAPADPPNEPQPTHAYLLPGFDEFMLGYKDRSAALSPQDAEKICPGSNGMFFPTMVLDGHVCGTWKSSLKARSCRIEPKPFVALSPAQKEAFAVPALAYEHFLGMPVTISWPNE